MTTNSKGLLIQLKYKSNENCLNSVLKRMIKPTSRMIRSILLIIAFSAGSVVAQNPSAAEYNIEGIFEIGTVQSLMLEKEGEILFEEYRGGMDRNRTTNIKSASKSILSLLIGIAIERGDIKGVDQKISHYFPDYFESNSDSIKETITIKDLLTMRSGLETTSFSNYGRWVLSGNWIEFALDQPLEHDPGGRMIYSTGSSHLLSVILTRASGKSTREYAMDHLFGPMNIQIGGWDRDPQGYYMGGNNVALSPHALLKLGRLLGDMGKYEGQQLVPETWIRDSIDIYTRSNFNDYNFGYMWWRKSAGEMDVLFAWGNGGQYIMILPELNAVVIITSDVERGTGSRAYQRRVFSFLEQTIIPYLTDAG